MQINPSHHLEVKNPQNLQDLGHFYKFKNSYEKIQEFILRVFRKFKGEKSSDYEQTLNFLLTKPNHEFPKEALEKLFTEISVSGELAHLSREGPCLILNSYLKKAIIKSHHAFIQMVLQSRGEVNLENWLLLHNSPNKDFLKYVPCISFLQNYQDDLLRTACEEVQGAQFHLLCQFSDYATLRNELDPKEAPIWKAFFIKLLKIYAHSCYIEIEILRKLDHWILKHFTLQEIYQRFDGNLMDLAISLIERKNPKSLLSFQIYYFKDAIEKKNAPLIEIMLNHSWMINAHQYKSTIAEFAAQNGSEEILCQLWNFNFFEPKISPKVILEACKKRWTHFLGLYCNLKENFTIENITNQCLEVFEVLLPSFSFSEKIVSQLLQSCLKKKRKLAHIHQLLNHYPFIFLSRSLLESLLHKSLEKDYICLFKKIVEKGCPINKKVNGRYLLDYALERYAFQIVDYLLKLNAPSSCFSPLHKLCWNGEFNEFKKKINLNVINEKCYGGYSFLHLAILRKHYRLINWLLIKGIDVNLLNHHKENALHLAVKKNLFKVSKKLLKLGVNSLAKNKFGDTPLIISINRKLSFCKLLIENEILNNYKRITNLSQNSFLYEIAVCKNEEKNNLIHSFNIDLSLINEVVKRIELAHIWGIDGKTLIGKQAYALEGWQSFPANQVVVKSLLDFFNTAESQKRLESYSKGIHAKLIEGIKSLKKNFYKSSQSIINDIKKGQVVALSTGWEGHETTLIFYRDKVVKINRGYYRSELFNISIYHAQAPNNLNKELIDEIRFVTNKETFLYKIDQQLKLVLENGLVISNQKVGNCAVKQPSSIPRAILYLLLEEKFSQSADEISKNEYQSWKVFFLKQGYWNYIQTSQMPDPDLLQKVQEKALQKKINLFDF